jgi:hypothetical protein
MVDPACMHEIILPTKRATATGKAIVGAVRWRKPGRLIDGGAPQPAALHAGVNYRVLLLVRSGLVASAPCRALVDLLSEVGSGQPPKSAPLRCSRPPSGQTLQRTDRARAGPGVRRYSALLSWPIRYSSQTMSRGFEVDNDTQRGNSAMGSLGII